MDWLGFIIMNRFKEDDIGRTTLFYAIAKNDIKEVESIIFGLSGTGLGGQRASLIKHKDQMGLNSIEYAKKLEHKEIESLLAGELGRMEYFG